MKAVKADEKNRKFCGTIKVLIKSRQTVHEILGAAKAVLFA